MRCPFCKDPENKVIDSRESHEGLVIRRRRECLSCKRRFTTYERVEELTPANSRDRVTVRSRFETRAGRSLREHSVRNASDDL